MSIPRKGDKVTLISPYGKFERKEGACIISVPNDTGGKVIDQNPSGEYLVEWDYICAIAAIPQHWIKKRGE